MKKKLRLKYSRNRKFLRMIFFYFLIALRVCLDPSFISRTTI